jgi:hypothetical protein
MQIVTAQRTDRTAAAVKSKKSEATERTKENAMSVD